MDFKSISTQSPNKHQWVCFYGFQICSQIHLYAALIMHMLIICISHFTSSGYPCFGMNRRHFPNFFSFCFLGPRDFNFLYWGWEKGPCCVRCLWHDHKKKVDVQIKRLTFKIPRDVGLTCDEHFTHCLWVKLIMVFAFEKNKLIMVL